MAMYMTRVELHSANYVDYQQLHQFMTTAGFQTFVRDFDYKSYRLPPAEYYLNSTTVYSAAEIRNLAKNCADRTGKASSVITARSDDIAWNNLDPL